MKTKFASILNRLVLTLPFFTVSKLISILDKRNLNLMKRLPLRFLVSPVILPDGQQILWSWSQDPFWLQDIIEEVYHQHLYEHFFSVNEKEVTVDIGANVGLFSLKSSKVVGKNGMVVAIEPEKNNFKLLQRNLMINKCQNVFPVNVAISNFDGIADFLVSSEPVEHKLSESKSELAPHFVNTVKINVRTIKTVLDQLGISEVDFLKIDAEGAEFEVLSGAKSLLESRKIKKISVAVYHSKDQKKLVSDYLHKFNYKVSSFESEGLCNFPKAHVYGLVNVPKPVTFSPLSE